MRLLRVQIPEYRGLKNIDISFEQDLTPQVFPIGGENGSGKSTLLQLIFTLLSCTGGDDERKKFLANAIRHLKKRGEKWKMKSCEIAKIEIMMEDEPIQLSFSIIPVVYNDVIYENEDSKNIELLTKQKDELNRSNAQYAGKINLAEKGLRESEVYVCCPNLTFDHFTTIKNCIFLAGQATQPYLFLTSEENRNCSKPKANTKKF